MTEEARAAALLETLAARCAALLGGAMTGFYLHGSLTLGCFRWARSDLDFLLVTERAPRQKEKEALARLLLDAGPLAPPKGLEMSAVQRRACGPAAVFPAPFDFHFSPLHAARFAADLPACCAAMHGRDPDLAAHFAMARARGRALRGPRPEDVFAPVPRAALLESLRGDLAAGPAADPTYFTLNLCRALAFARDGLLLSKAEGADWALPRLPAHRAVIAAAREHCLRGGPAPEPAAARRLWAETEALLN